jgi:hypothetical protein
VTGMCVGSGLVGKGGWCVESGAMGPVPVVGGQARVNVVGSCQCGAFVGPVAGVDPYQRMFFFSGQSSLKA